ncbi:DNA topoisomerase IB, partial [Pseudomonas aeruginosa]
HIDAQLRLPGLGRDKVVALAVALLDATLIRVGNHRYARDNRSYGLTTLRTRHVDVNGSRIRFRFKGKSGIEHDVSLEHPRLARVLRRCLELPGQDLLQYLDEDGQPHRIGSHDINEYLR